MASNSNAPSRWPDGVETYAADDRVLAGYEKAREELAQFSAPRLVGADKPHERMALACSEGYDGAFYTTNLTIVGTLA